MKQYLLKICSILPLVVVMLFSDNLAGQTNVAPLATATQSGGGVTIYGPANYNDLVIPNYNNLPWGWVSSNGWIQYEWTTPVRVSEVIFHNDNRPANTGNVEVWNGSAFVVAASWNAPSAQQHTVSLGQPYTTTRMRFTQLAGSNPNFREIEVIEAKAFDYTAHVGEISSPTSPICGTGFFQDLRVRFCNDGSKPIDSIQMGGILLTSAGSQRLPPIPMPNVTIKETVKPGDCSRTHSIYTHSAGFKTLDTLIIWTALPNGVQDSLDEGDTIMYIIKPSLQKQHFTVGDTNVGSFDFHRLDHAFDYFASIGGICDSLIVEIDTSHDKLALNRQYEFPNLIGSNVNTPIILRGMASNPYNVTLRYDSTDEDNNYIIAMEKVGHVYIENINFYTRDLYNTDYSANIALSDGAHDIQFSNCNFRSQYNNADRNNSLIIGSKTGDNITIDNCEFLSGADGVFIAEGSGHIVMNSNFKDQFLASIHFTGAENIEVRHNTFASVAKNVANGGYDGLGIAIRLNDIKNSIDISYNTINVSNSEWPSKGILVQNYNRALGKSFIGNNSINIGQPWSAKNYSGILADDANFLEIYNNSIALNGNNSDNACVNFENSNRNTLVNNIMEIQVAGDVVFQSAVGSVTNSDHNDYYGPSGTDLVTIDGSGGGSYSTLTALQAASGMEANSFNVNPIFYDVKRNNLHVCNNLLSNTGMPLATVPVDIDNDPRSQTPSIGADEFTPISQVRLVNDYGLCPGDSTVITAGGGNFGETAIWKDLTTTSIIDTNYSINVKTPGDYEVTFFNACGVVVDTITIISPVAVKLPNDTNLCQGASLLVDASITDGVDYAWGTSDTTATYTVAMQATYNVTATDKWGCVTDDQFDVTYSPAADIPQPDTIVCLTKFFDINSSIDISIGATFKWSGFPAAASETDPIISVLADDVNDKDYIYVEVNHRGCITTDSIQINVITTPRIDIKDTTNGLLFTVLTNNSGGNSHSWTFGDGNSSSFAKPKHIYAKGGVYEVTYSNNNICGNADTSYEVTVLYLSLSENNDEAGVMVYPNPNNGEFNLDFNGVNAEDVMVSIIDVNGRVVFDKNYGSISGSNHDEINLSGIAPGYYTINVELDNEVYQKKFIVK